MIVQVIKTPTDFEPTIGFDDFVIEKLVSPPAPVEPDVRHAMAAIFDDLPVIDSGEPGMVSGYLDAIEDPLATLSELGLRLVAIQTSGTLTLPGAPHLGTSDPQSMPWRRVHYLLAPDPCYYKAGGAREVHILGVECEGTTAFTRGGESVRAWGSRAALERDFERSVPWCDTCFLHGGVEAI